MKNQCNFSVRATRKDKGKPPEVIGEILIKRFIRKYKQSGISQELREKSYPQTRGMKKRKKKHQGKMRHLKKNKR